MEKLQFHVLFTPLHPSYFSRMKKNPSMSHHSSRMEKLYYFYKSFKTVIGQLTMISGATDNPERYMHIYRSTCILIEANTKQSPSELPKASILGILELNSPSLTKLNRHEYRDGEE